MPATPEINFEKIHREMTAIVTEVNKAFQAYRGGRLNDARADLLPQESANENDLGIVTPDVAPIDFREGYYGDYAPAIVGACIDRLRNTQEEIKCLLELRDKVTPKAKDEIDSDIRDGLDYLARGLDWLISQDEKKDVRDSYAADLRAEDQTMRSLILDFLENTLPGDKGRQSNVQPLRVSQEELENILERIAECRYKNCEIEYGRVEVSMYTAADFLKRLIDDKLAGKTSPDAPSIEEFITETITKSQAQLMQLPQRLEAIDTMRQNGRHDRECKQPYLPLEFPDFHI